MSLPDIAMNFPFPQAISEITSGVSSEWAVQVFPSGEVRIVPESPPTTNWLSAQIIFRRFRVVVEFSLFHSDPFSDDKMVPFAPMMTNRPLPHAPPVKVAVVPEGGLFHTQISEPGAKVNKTIIINNGKKYFFRCISHIDRNKVIRGFFLSNLLLSEYYE